MKTWFQTKEKNQQNIRLRKPLYLNGKAKQQTEINHILNQLSNPNILTQYGGALFKYQNHSEDELLIDDFGIIPCIVDGERTHHYDIQLKKETSFTLIGIINANGIFRVVFKPEEIPLSDDDSKQYKKQFIQLSRFLQNNGFSGSIPLDGITCDLLQEASLFIPSPKELVQLYQ